MCRRVECPKCGRPTYAGCGLHVEQVLGDVAPGDRCSCRETQPERPGDTAEPGARSWLRSLLGK